MIEALKPGVVSLIRDLNGNHVIQRCLQVRSVPVWSLMHWQRKNVTECTFVADLFFVEDTGTMQDLSVMSAWPCARRHASPLV